MKIQSPLSLLSIVAITSIAPFASAQTYQPSNRIPVADNSLGTQVSGANNNFTITGGLNRGQNLFHSFTDFSVPTGGAATFDNSLGKQSIITRVTGGNFSDINGLVNTQGANFFLLNPNGIVFGTNAQLNVGQTFVGSTANGIDLVDSGGRTVNFGTNRSGDTQLLTINPNALFNVSRLNMGVGNGQISNFGTLQTTGLGQYIGLIGGNVTMNGGQIYALGGRVELGGLSAPGTVTLGVDGNNFRAQFPANVARGDVSLTNQSAIRVEGIGGGDIAIAARNLEILGGSFVSGGIFPGFGTPESVAGDIKVNATGSVVVGGSNNRILNQVGLNSIGNGGNITIEAGSLDLKDGAVLGTSTFGQGRPGNVSLRVKGAVSLINSGIFITVEGDSVGTAKAGDFSTSGDIYIQAGSLSLRDGAQLETSTRQRSGIGDAGNINVLVTGAVDIAGTKDGFSSRIRSIVSPQTIGNTGNININAGSVSLSDGAILATSNQGAGNAGDVRIIAFDDISLTNASIFIVADNIIRETGQAREERIERLASIDIETKSLSLREGSEIRNVIIPGGLTQDKPDSDIERKTGNININSSMIIAGDISIDASSILTSIENGVKSDGGNININTRSLLLRNGTQISTNGNGTIQQNNNGGNITINAPNGFIIAAPNENSDISANAFSGSGGKVNINTQQNFWISPLNRSELEKRLGTTDPTRLNPFTLPTNDITAISQVNPSLSGQVSITPPQIDITAGLSPLPNNVTDPTNQINPNCSAKAIANNSFTNVGRGGIPATPKDPLNDQEIATNWVRLNPQDTIPSTPIATTPAQLPKPIVEAQGWRRERNGDIVLVAGSSIGTLPRQPQSGCAVR